MEDQTRVSSVTLIVTGVTLDPDTITKAFGFFPDRSWREGERPPVIVNGREVLTPSEPAGWGGWKKFMPAHLESVLLQDQLLHWTDVLSPHQETLKAFKGRGWDVTLDCFLSFDGSELIEISSELLASLASIGVDLAIHVHARVGNDA